MLPSGQTTAPNAYSSAIAVSKAGAAGATVTFALTAGSLPPGLSMSAPSGSGTVITREPRQGRNVQPLYQAYSIAVDQSVPLAINASGGRGGRGSCLTRCKLAPVALPTVGPGTWCF